MSAHIGLCCGPHPCQISSSDNQLLDTVNVDVNLLNELLIDGRGVYGGITPTNTPNKLYSAVFIFCEVP